MNSKSLLTAVIKMKNIKLLCVFWGMLGGYSYAASSHIFLFAGATMQEQAADVYRTQVMRENIRSLEVKVQGKVISTPYIELNGDNVIEISFDALFHDGGRYTYSVIHCDADRKKSALIPLEYMKGFQQTPINDYGIAIGTTTHYTNYKLTLPNEHTQLTVSGNLLFGFLRKMPQMRLR